VPFALASQVTNRHHVWVPAAPPPTNIQVQRPSRKRLLPGDMFRVRLPEARFVFGRVMRADCTRETAPMPSSNLIYVYRPRSASPEPDLSLLTPDALLLPPMFINRMPWSRGYFETVGHAPLTGRDWLPAHCFRKSNGTYRDEIGQPLPAERQPCGDWALHSFRSFDDAVSDALEIPRVPE
jgi:hypothetical protein